MVRLTGIVVVELIEVVVRLTDIVVVLLLEFRTRFGTVVVEFVKLRLVVAFCEIVMFGAPR